MLKRCREMVPLNTSVQRGGEVNPHQFIVVNPKLELLRCTDILFRRDL